ncbi:DUF7535 family protein [Halosimplex salinum]|uniref:DUF7535 family protein n=1 Tax=Halosimplex salinum TaxID=1710538 RepID=UPI000F482F70|nr:hypothetical protein [Halosimplex salinum]
MSDTTADESEDPGTATQLLRTVTPGTGYRPDVEMDSLGWALFLGLVILLVPLLPFLIVGWLFTKALDFLARQRGSEGAD